MTRTRAWAGFGARLTKGYENLDIVFDRCRFNGRPEIDLWGGRGCRFINNIKSWGGFDDGITAKTRGEPADPLHSGDIDIRATSTA